MTKFVFFPAIDRWSLRFVLWSNYEMRAYFHCRYIFAVLFHNRLTKFVILCRKRLTKFVVLLSERYTNFVDFTVNIFTKFVTDFGYSRLLFVFYWRIDSAEIGKKTKNNKSRNLANSWKIAFYVAQKHPNTVPEELQIIWNSCY